MVAYPAKIRRDGTAFVAEFPDFPFVHSFGYSREECLRQAQDGLESAFMAFMSDRKDIPAPSRVPSGMVGISPSALGAAKVALYRTMRKSGLRKADLARKLGWQKSQVDRLLDLRHDSRLDQLERAVAVLGKRMRILIDDAA